MIAGALVRWHDGFGCLQPWPEFGHAPLAEHLASLAGGNPTALSRRTLDCCTADGAARRRGENLFRGMRIPPSHATLPALPSPEECDALCAQGFFSAKLKVPGTNRIDWIREFIELASRDDSLLFRLDFNASCTAAEFHRFVMELPAAVRERIEFAEDPAPYDSGQWRALRQMTKVPLAIDWITTSSPPAPDSFDLQVFKPACQEIPPEPGRFVITSAMDHPVGQLFAAWEAARRFDQVDVCGLLTHPLFEPDAFLERMRSDGPFLLPPEGTGLGFDDLLEKLPWKRLS
jgi:O-succinylbenzoate synthase